MTTLISPNGQKNNEFAQWDITKKYRVGDLVVYSGKIYEANDLVPVNTPFAIGTTGSTWAQAVITAAVVDQMEFTRGGIITESDIPTAHSGNTISIIPSSGTSPDQQLLIYPTVAPGNNHLHLTSGNLYNTELFFGDDSLYVMLANSGNIVVNTDDSVGNSAQWTFGTDGALSMPGDANVSGNLNVSGNTDLGDIINVKITGGTSGQVLSTDGSGALTWTTAGGGSGASNGTSSTQVNASNVTTVIGGTTIETIDANGVTITGNANVSGNVNASYFIGNGSQLTNIVGSNIVGNVTSAITANFANYAGNITVNAQPNITSVGTLTTLVVSGNSSTSGLYAKNFTTEAKAQTTTTVIDFAQSVQQFTVSAARTFTTSNVPVTGTVASVSLILVVSSNATVTWPTGTKWPSGTAPTLANGTHIISLITYDGGTTYLGAALTAYA